MKNPSPVFKFRAVLGFFIFGLVVSGVTAFPLLLEMRLLSQIMVFLNLSPDSDLVIWISRVHHGLEDSYQKYPWIAYGTDWLAFGHIIISLFFVGPFLDPLSSRNNLIVGITACILVFPLALICGPIRDIPGYWTLIDCSFGFFGIFPLLYCLKLRKEIENQAAACSPLSAGRSS